jgi:hypothetical protein
MNKRRLHHLWTRVRWIKPGYFLIIATVSVIIALFALRTNNEHMIILRQAVYAADQNNTDVESALRQLQLYVTSHMNTNLSSGSGTVYPPIQLKYTYERILQAQTQAVATTNGQLYTDAQTYCQQLDPVDFSGRNRVPCIEQYVQSHDTKLPSIPASLYEFSFASPFWSPDLAGFSILAAIISGTLFVGTLVTNQWFRRRIT